MQARHAVELALAAFGRLATVSAVLGAIRMIKPRLDDQRCPSCGVSRLPGAEECARCGVVYRKFEALQKQRLLAGPATRAAAPERHRDWNRPVALAAGVALLALVANAGALFHALGEGFDALVRVDSLATGGAPLQVQRFSCHADGDGLLAEGEVLNRLEAPMSPQIEVSVIDRLRGDLRLSAEGPVQPATLPPHGLGRFAIRLDVGARGADDCRVVAAREAATGQPIRLGPELR